MIYLLIFMAFQWVVQESIPFYVEKGRIIPKDFKGKIVDVVDNGNRVIVVDKNGNFYGISKKTGLIRWKNSYRNLKKYEFFPDKILVFHDEITMINRENGEVVWSYPLGCDGAGHCNVTVLGDSDKYIYLGGFQTNINQIMILDKMQGVEKWPSYLSLYNEISKFFLGREKFYSLFKYNNTFLLKAYNLVSGFSSWSYLFKEEVPEKDSIKIFETDNFSVIVYTPQGTKNSTTINFVEKSSGKLVLSKSILMCTPDDVEVYSPREGYIYLKTSHIISVLDGKKLKDLKKMFFQNKIGYSLFKDNCFVVISGSNIYRLNPLIGSKEKLALLPFPVKKGKMLSKGRCTINNDGIINCGDFFFVLNSSSECNIASGVAKSPLNLITLKGGIIYGVRNTNIVTFGKEDVSLWLSKIQKSVFQKNLEELLQTYSMVVNVQKIVGQSDNNGFLNKIKSLILKKFFEEKIKKGIIDFETIERLKNADEKLFLNSVKVLLTFAPDFVPNNDLVELVKSLKSKDKFEVLKRFYKRLQQKGMAGRAQKLALYLRSNGVSLDKTFDVSYVIDEIKESYKAAKSLFKSRRYDECIEILQSIPKIPNIKSVIPENSEILVDINILDTLEGSDLKITIKRVLRFLKNLDAKSIKVSNCVKECLQFKKDCELIFSSEKCKSSYSSCGQSCETSYKPIHPSI